jgi:hypothetical protein
MPLSTAGRPALRYGTMRWWQEGTGASAHVMKPVHPTKFHVTRREELAAAIKQRTAPIVIENEELAQPFVRYRRTLTWWIVGPIAASRIMRSAFPEIEFQATEWRVDYTTDYKIILVPRR